MQVMAALDRLVAKSLAAVEAGNSTLRYRLLGSVRVHSAEKLRASGEADTWRLGRIPRTSAWQLGIST
jgi:predicted ATPase